MGIRSPRLPQAPPATAMRERNGHVSHDTWIHRLAKVAVPPLAALKVRPNHITTLRLATGLAAAGAFALGSAAAAYSGAALFLISMVLDRLDGALARATGQMSAWGHRYDIVADCVANAAAFVGIGIGASLILGPIAPVLGVAAGIGIVAILWIVVRVEANRGARAAELKGAAGFDPDDAMLVVPIAVLFGGEAVLTIAAGIGAPVFAAFMGWRFRRAVGLGAE